jgi:uncharacterized protein YggT (Ycf19 family)
MYYVLEGTEMLKHPILRFLYTIVFVKDYKKISVMSLETSRYMEKITYLLARCSEKLLRPQRPSSDNL